MEVFRLSRKKFADPLSGKGAAIKGARWNSPGVEMIYTAGNRSLAMAEVAVHLSFATLPDDYLMLTIYIPDDISITKLQAKHLPVQWNRFPHLIATQALGDKFISDKKCCVLQVPSAVTKGDHNFLIDPHHQEFGLIKVINTEKFPFDSRLFK